jgi:predicted enzyme related to lactoylglutathione lyase
MKKFVVAGMLLALAAGSAFGQESRIRSVRVSAPDVVKTATFYEAVFGLKEARRVERDKAPYEIILNYGKDAAEAAAATSTKLVVILRDPKAPPPSVSNLVFGVKNLDATVKSAIAAGGTQSRAASQSATTGSKVAFIKDPAGNEIELIEEK